MTKRKIQKLLSVCVLLAVALSPVSCGKADGDTVLGYLGGDPLTKAEYRYYLKTGLYDVAPYLSEENYTEYLGSDAGGISMEESLKNVILDNAKQIRAIESKYAELGLDFEENSEEDFKEALLDAFAYYGGEEVLREMLEEEGLEYSVFERQQKAAVMADAVEYELFQKPGAPHAVTEEELREAYGANYVYVKHILVSTSDENAQPLSEEARGERKAAAENLLARARAGEDFESLASAYGDRAGVQIYAEGYPITRGETDAIFEEAAFALAPGEISELTESRYGFHIIEGCPLEYGAAYENIKEDVSRTARYAKMQDLMREWVNDMEIEILYDLIERDESLSPAAALEEMLRNIAEEAEDAETSAR
jgi:foldase protein PrsA